MSPEIATGMPAPGAAPITAGPGVLQVSVGDVLYAGLAPGYVGLYQLNVRVANTIASGNADLYLSWNNCCQPPGGPPPNYHQSNIVKLPVQ